jgi:hypothetical protein
VRSINGLPLRFISGRTCSAPQRPLIYSRAEPPYRPQDSAYGRDDAPPSRSRPRSRSGSPIAGGIRRGRRNSRSDRSGVDGCIGNRADRPVRLDHSRTSAQERRQIGQPRYLIDCGRLHRSDLKLALVLRAISNPLDNGAPWRPRTKLPSHGRFDSGRACAKASHQKGIR